MTKQSLRSGVSMSAFAHLLGFAAKAANKSAEDDKDRDEDEPAAEDGDDDEDKKKDAKGKKAKADNDDADASAEDGDDEDDGDVDDEDGDKKKDAKGKKAKAAEGDDEGDDSEREKGKKAERTRWTKVLSHANAGQGRTAAACEMLANSGLSSAAIIRTLAAVPTGGRGALRDRMNGEQTASIGSGGGSPAAAKPGDDFAAQMSAAMGKVRPDAAK